MSYLQILGEEVELPITSASAITTPGKIIRIFNDDGVGNAIIITILDSQDKIKGSFRIAHHVEEFIKLDVTDKLYASHSKVFVTSIAYPGG